MKKALLLLFALSLTASTFAQEANQKSGKPKYKISAYHAIGSDFALSSLPFDYNGKRYTNIGARLHILNGIQFNPWLILAFDLQLAYNHLYEYSSGVEMPMKWEKFNGPLENVGVKIGVDFRYRMLNRPKWSPIMGIALGPSLEMFT